MAVTPDIRTPYKGHIKTFRLCNSRGSCVDLTNYGARVMAISLSGRDGKPVNVALGLASPPDYQSDRCYLGATIGHIANRVSGGEYTLNGYTYSQDRNDGANSNHGGRFGFDKALFECILHTSGKVVFVLDTPDGYGGHPGNMQIEITYTFSEDDELRTEYRANTDRPTPLNLTNHTYFNLSGGTRPATLNLLQINADMILETDTEYIPTGNVIAIGGTGYDFRQPRKICDPVLQPGTCRYNHYYILDRDNKESVAARLCCEHSGLYLEVATSYPGILFYSGDFLQSTTPGLHGGTYRPFDGICLEAQLFPDAVNRPEFPTVILDPDETYIHFIAYRFGIF